MQKATNVLEVEIILKNGFEKTGLHLFSSDGINYEKYFKKLVEYSTTDPQITQISDDNASISNDFDPQTNITFYKVSPCGDNVTLNVPSLFRKVLFWPSQNKEQIKKRKDKEKLPTVVTSDAWKQYYEAKAEKKRKEEGKKEAN
ncbi:hypothetical protein PUN28_010879 [Cardiocondyla obscurior]|uniref:Uncharacterized protein n=1 Tax=Cardiocondyla obscurior TaxID=286306 RepID=A0AAW2FNE4_9HYME